MFSLKPKTSVRRCRDVSTFESGGTEEHQWFINVFFSLWMNVHMIKASIRHSLSYFLYSFDQLHNFPIYAWAVICIRESYGILQRWNIGCFPPLQSFRCLRNTLRTVQKLLAIICLSSYKHFQIEPRWWYTNLLFICILHKGLKSCCVELAVFCHEWTLGLLICKI